MPIDVWRACAGNPHLYTTTGKNAVKKYRSTPLPSYPRFRHPGFSFFFATTTRCRPFCVCISILIVYCCFRGEGSRAIGPSGEGTPNEREGNGSVASPSGDRLDLATAPACTIEGYPVYQKYLTERISKKKNSYPTRITI